MTRLALAPAASYLDAPRRASGRHQLDERDAQLGSEPSASTRAIVAPLRNAASIRTSGT